jgi:hypothetical protein
MPVTALGHVTRGQLRDLAIALHRFGLTTRDQALGYCSAVVAHPITSRKELTTREASRVMDVLEGQLSDPSAVQSSRS